MSEITKPEEAVQLTDWINTEGMRRLGAMEADPSLALTADQVFYPDDEDIEWLKTVGVARYDAYDANTCDVLTKDEMLGHVTSGCVKPDEALCGASRERPTYY